MQPNPSSKVVDPRDENDLLLAGELPTDPFEGTVPAPPGFLPPEPRPEFLVLAGQGHKAVAFAIEQLAKDSRVFQRGIGLVTITQWTNTDRETEEKKAEKKRLDRAVGAPVIAAISGPKAWTILSELVEWKRRDARLRKDVPQDPPDRIVAGAMAALDWPGVRPLVGITTTPILRDDGSIHCTPGYDEDTGFFLAPSGDLPIVLSNPTLDDAKAAADQLLDVVCDFPFVNDAARSGWLAAVLTPIARHLCPCVPMFVFDANGAGTGKSLLADTVGIIASGRQIPHGAYVEKDDEMRKRVLSHLMTGDSMVLIDNAPNGKTIGWPIIDNLITATEYIDRELGVSRNSSIPNTMTWYLTGNNLSVRGDTARRILRIRIESQLEHPEDRPTSELKHAPLLEWVAAEQASLLGAALTILSAFLKAGRPASDASTLGSFERWSSIVRNAIRWVGLDDPIELLAAKDADIDPRVGAHVRLLEAMLRYPNGLTAAEMIDCASEGPEQDKQLHEAISELCPGFRTPLPTPKTLGLTALREIRGKVRSISDGLQAKLDHRDLKKSKVAAKWYLIKTNTAEKTGYEGIIGYLPIPTGVDGNRYDNTYMPSTGSSSVGHPKIPLHPIDQTYEVNQQTFDDFGDDLGSPSDESAWYSREED